MTHLPDLTSLNINIWTTTSCCYSRLWTQLTSHYKIHCSLAKCLHMFKLVWIKQGEQSGSWILSLQWGHSIVPFKEFWISISHFNKRWIVILRIILLSHFVELYDATSNIWKSLNSLSLELDCATLPGGEWLWPSNCRAWGSTAMAGH